jgi:3-methyladenine DNA glycosylase AlkD
MSSGKTTREVMRELAALADPKMREANERRGDDHGVNLTHLRALAKRLKRECSDTVERIHPRIVLKSEQHV